METSPTPTRILLACATRDSMLVRRAILEEAGYEVFASFPLEATMTLDSSTFSIGVVASDRADTELIRTIRERFKDIQIIQISGFVNALGLTPETTGADDVIEKK